MKVDVVVPASPSLTVLMVSVDVKQHYWNWLRSLIRVAPVVTGLRESRFGLAVRRYAGKRGILGSVLLRLTYLFKGCGLWTQS